MKSKASPKSQSIHRILKAIKFSDRTFKRLLSNPKRGGAVYNTRKKSILHELHNISGFCLHTYHNQQSKHKHILFFHGGAFFAQAVAAHRKMAEYLVEKFGFKVSLFDYPLAPEHQAKFTIEMVEKAYSSICETFPNDDIYLLGDSAGGGLALVLLQQLRHNSNLPMPIKSALLSPWVDVSMTNPDIEKFEKIDAILSKKGLQDCGQIYAGELSKAHHLVSPIYGDLNGLGSVKIWIGDWEMLYPDAVLLHEKLNAANGTESELKIMPEMMHDWIVLPIPEAKTTMNEIGRWLSLSSSK